MSGINVIFEGPSRWVLSEHLAYELYEKSGLHCEKSGHLRLSMDGKTLGYYLFVEQPNKTFLARTGRNEDGNLYKLLWYEHGAVRQHEKKTNLSTGHDDIVTLIDTLNKKSGEAQWAYIKEQFNVDEVANYFAVNMCIQNWDGFFNNYFAYHDLAPGGKWEMIPWDEDKTWGDYDGVSRRYDWYDMPLTMGMNGESSGKSWLSFNQGPLVEEVVGGGPRAGFPVLYWQIRNFEKNSRRGLQRFAQRCLRKKNLVPRSRACKIGCGPKSAFAHNARA